MELFNPANWPVPRIDWFFDGLRQYYSNVARANPEAMPLLVWGFYFVMSWIAKRVPWVGSNKIPELIAGLFTGRWLEWFRERKAASERLKSETGEGEDK